MTPEPIAVNFHITRACSSSCQFCFATFGEAEGRLELADALAVLVALRHAGAEKLTFAGGEPTIHPHIGELLAASRALGFVTCLVTNGYRLHQVLDEHAADLDWVGLSVDSADEGVQLALGRGAGDHVARSVALARRCHALGLRVKLNTVVTAHTWQEDMSPLVRTVCPHRWKVFQVLPMAGQNDGRVEPLLITGAQFRSFVDRHAHLADEGFAPVAEANDEMRGSYVMIDPLGRFFGNATGRHVTSEPILQVGVDAALAQVGFQPHKFEARGGRYAW